MHAKCGGGKKKDGKKLLIPVEEAKEKQFSVWNKNTFGFASYALFSPRHHLSLVRASSSRWLERFSFLLCKTSPLHHLSLSTFPLPIIIMLLFRIFLFLRSPGLNVGDMEKLCLNLRGVRDFPAPPPSTTNHHLSTLPPSIKICFVHLLSKYPSGHVCRHTAKSMT